MTSRRASTSASSSSAAETDATFEIVREDTEVKPPVALGKAKKLILQDKVDVMAGIVSSGVLGAVRDMVHGAGVPLIVANAGNDEATGRGLLALHHAHVASPTAR